MGDEYNYEMDYSYLKEKDTAYLIEVIEKMVDFDEATEAMSILMDRDLKKALELTVEILEKDKGDEYVQGLFWWFLFDEDSKDVLIESLNWRKEPLGKVLVGDIIASITGYPDKLEVPEEFIEKIEAAYQSLDEDEKEWIEDMFCDHDEFARQYLN